MTNALRTARAQIFGDIASILSTLPNRRATPVSIFSEIYFPAFRHDQIRVFENSAGDPVGFVVWAMLSQLTHDRLLETFDVRLHLSEWNDGDQLWILDFAVEGSSLQSVVDQCVKMFNPHEFAVTRRVRNGITIFHEIDSDWVRRLAARKRLLASRSLFGRNI